MWVWFLSQSGGSPGGKHGNPLQYSCLEHPMDRGAWWAKVHRVAESWTQLKWLSTHHLKDWFKISREFKIVYVPSRNKHIYSLKFLKMGGFKINFQCSVKKRWQIMCVWPIKCPKQRQYVLLKIFCIYYLTLLFFLIEVQLINRVVPISAVQESNSSYTHIFYF